MSTDIVDYLKTDEKFETARRLLKENKFENVDIGPINEIDTISKFVISIPKCGTTAIQRGFERIGHRVIHAHNNLTTYAAFANGDLLRREGIGLETLIGRRRHLNTEPIHFFFGYREPVSWYLSLAGQFSLPLNEALRAGIDCNLRDGYPWSRYRFAESKKLTERASGLKIFSTKFDIRTGYTVIRKKNIYLVLYRCDRMQDLEDYIQNNIDGKFQMKFERVNANPDYLEFVENFRLSAPTLEALYGGKIFSHFYDSRETAQLVSNYLEGGTRRVRTEPVAQTSRGAAL